MQTSYWAVLFVSLISCVAGVGHVVEKEQENEQSEDLCGYGHALQYYFLLQKSLSMGSF